MYIERGGEPKHSGKEKPRRVGGPSSIDPCIWA